LALEVYRKKRKFGVTAEPRGRKGRHVGDAYVIQKHAASRLHYDLRLELDGVMKSWAVTRGPSLDPAEKRLAVEVEDHPIEYNKFEGTIPKGEYGGGTVMIWDRGHWKPEGDPHKGYDKGHLIFDLEGEKLHGRWHLVRMRSRPKERHQNWLLIKGKDDAARAPRGKDILDEQPLSAVTGRSIEQIAAGKGRKQVWHSNRENGHAASEEAKSLGPRPKSGRAKAFNAAVARKSGKRTQERRLPGFVPPSLATLHSTAPSGDEWLHEIKFDGYRIEARFDRGRVRLLTRKGLDWTHRFKPIADAVAALKADTALIDGEVVSEDERGISSFSLLQTDLKDDKSDRFRYCVFDLLYLDGRDLRDEPLIMRKAALERLVRSAGNDSRIRYTEHFDEDGKVILKHACGMDLEGVVSKLREAPYRSGRSENFIKSKCHNAQEFVIVGFSPSTAEPNAVGALTVAVHDNGALRYAGRIGTGYTRKIARDLWRRLKNIETKRPPMPLPKDERRKDVIWVKPQLVVEAEFRGVTHGNLLRQASYKGLREDKPAREVVREVPEATMTLRQVVRKSAKPTAAKSKTATKPGKSRPESPKTVRGRPSAEVGHVHLTHPDRVYWADVGVTKEDLAEYYVGVWDWISPHIVGRALSLVRSPEGVGGETFFQKHIAANVKSSPLRHPVATKEHDVIAVEKLDDVVALVQSGALEIHVRGSRLDALENCDRLVFDLDPGEGVTWKDIVAAARETRERLEQLKLKSFVKLSGGKGVHVAVPIADADWDTAKNFTQAVALSMAADSPQRYVGKMTKSLRKGKIFIDYFRNSRDATSVAPYSTRARPGAPVSAPLSWEQFGRSKSAAEFTVLNLKRHFKHDPWADMAKVRQKLPAK
jgi:bifunctional non-homologous end joining protein LigD